MNDTSADMARLYRRLLLEKTPAERLAMASDMFDTARELIVADLARRGETRLREGLFLRLYGDDFEPAERERILAAIRAAGRPYTREELRALSDEERAAPPERGDWCPRCKVRIPQFADLDRDEERRLVAQGLPAATQLADRLGCPWQWVRQWIVHAFGHPDPDSPPCRWCGAPLGTKRAQQCIACGMDWHAT